MIVELPTLFVTSDVKILATPKMATFRKPIRMYAKT
jgi:hypothetical protein